MLPKHAEPVMDGAAGLCHSRGDRGSNALTVGAMCCGQLESHPRFRREAKNPMVFHVNHYAGPVNYDTNSFLDKNRDVLQADLIQVPPHATLVGNFLLMHHNKLGRGYIRRIELLALCPSNIELALQ
jgi:hypothetical protein